MGDWLMEDETVSKNTLKKHPSYRYTAIGDSIAFGIGATNNYGYVNYFKNYLSTEFDCVKLTNKSLPFFTSSKLLNLLRQDSQTRESVENADLITISIGGGNILDCFSNGILNETCAANAVLTFINDWPQIMSEIRDSIGSEAKILVMTVYNPLIGSIGLYDILENYIQQINSVISSLAYRSMYHYKLVDVHSAFQGLFPNGSWKVCTWTHICESNPDPHPTNSGLKEIARLHELVYC